MKKLLGLIVTSLLFVVPLTYSEGLLSNPMSFMKSDTQLMPVEQAFAFDAKQVARRVILSWVIADGYYMYRDKLQFAVDGANLEEIKLPSGTLHRDAYFGEQSVYYTYVEIPIEINQAQQDSQLTVTFMGCAEDKLCYPPTSQTIQLNAVAVNDASATSIDTTDQQDAIKKSPAQASIVSQQDALSQMLSGDSLLWTLAIFFALGVGLALTPCVFPMYPILSGIIVGQGKKLSIAQAFTLSMAYVQGMAITYSLLGLVVASAGLKYQAAFQHPVVLILLAGLFAVLSLSMFGLYELRLPSAWQQKMMQLSNSQQGGRLTGVFLMGVLSGLVASPCTTAPLSGALIYVAQTGDLLQGFLALYVLSMGMGLPLLIMGTSGGKLLPKAGAWMNIIKTVFGFLLLAVSVMMLERIWSGVGIEVLWSFWGVCLTGYLMHQNKLTTLNWQQTVRSVLLLLCLFGGVSYGYQAVIQALREGDNNIQPTLATEQSADFHGFKRVKSLDDLQTELALAAAQNKAVIVDFYADWCVACKEFEEITFTDPNVITRMNQMVLLQADVTKSDATDVALLEHYNVLGLPTLLLFNEQGQQREDLRVTGFMAPKAFSKHLDHLIKQ